MARPASIVQRSLDDVADTSLGKDYKRGELVLQLVRSRHGAEVWRLAALWRHVPGMITGVLLPVWWVSKLRLGRQCIVEPAQDLRAGQRGQTVFAPDVLVMDQQAVFLVEAGDALEHQ